jgi:hypothetical protein
MTNKRSRTLFKIPRTGSAHMMTQTRMIMKLNSRISRVFVIQSSQRYIKSKEAKELLVQMKKRTMKICE